MSEGRPMPFNLITYSNLETEDDNSKDKNIGVWLFQVGVYVRSNQVASHQSPVTMPESTINSIQDEHFKDFDEDDRIKLRSERQSRLLTALAETRFSLQQLEERLRVRRYHRMRVGHAVRARYSPYPNF